MNLLQTKDLLGYRDDLMGARSDQARVRLREEMSTQKLSQREVGDLLKWSQSRVARILTGRVELGLDELEAMCFALGMSLVEAVRDTGLEFCADLTPSELRMIHQIRQLAPLERDAILNILKKMTTNIRMESRHARPLKKNIPRGRG